MYPGYIVPVRIQAKPKADALVVGMDRLLYYACTSVVREPRTCGCRVRRLPARGFEKALIRLLVEIAGDEEVLIRLTEEGRHHALIGGMKEMSLEERKACCGPSSAGSVLTAGSQRAPSFLGDGRQGTTGSQLRRPAALEGAGNTRQVVIPLARSGRGATDSTHESAGRLRSRVAS
jgi:hypothetical protein